MAGNTDNYEIYYADKLWNLLPAIYRTLDTDTYDSSGPLREMVNRIGKQASIVRRSIDRLWEDQSIETCDDWVIPYIADLLATKLVASLDARGQRLDVAKTIYYRRRKGTVAILEEIAFDITGWNARVVEFFRRLGRTRHNLDPEVGRQSIADPSVHRLQLAEGLVGPLTNTGIGGWADLRNNYGASKANSAFDEYYHVADFRRGQGQVGWYNIPRLGVFLWRLNSFPVGLTTPVQSQSCPDQYTFDPTGREIRLFAVSDSTRYGDNWVSPAEWQLPTPISQSLLQADLQLPIAPQNQQHLYAMLEQEADGKYKVDNRSLGVFDDQGQLILGDQITADPTLTSPLNAAFFIDPVHGKLIRRSYGQAQFFTTYTYGFSSRIGAGPYDRRVIGEKPVDQPLPLIPPVSGGGSALTTPLATLGDTGTIIIDDSLTYTDVSNLANIRNVTLAGANETRPLIRLPAPTPSSVTEWVFYGADETQSVLRLEGLFISGADIVLQGGFKHVTITCCTFDPGEAAEVTIDPQTDPPKIYTPAVDGQDLLPCRLWIEAQVQQLTIKRSILGPLRTRYNGKVDILSLQDSIVQAIRTDDSSLFTEEDIKNPGALAILLRDAKDPLSAYLQAQFPADPTLLSSYDGLRPPSIELLQALLQELNSLLTGPPLYDAKRFAQVSLTLQTMQWVTQNLVGPDLVRLNRWLLQEAYPTELADKDSTLALNDGEVDLSRCTLLGPAYVHRLSAGECILDDIVLVDDAQHSCVRFSAWAAGSVLPRQYESVSLAPKSPLFTADRFGQPGYAQLLSSVDNAIVSGTTGATISAGAQDGSEMGVFAREKNPIKERSLLIKYEEFMPLGLTPVIIYVT